MIKKTVRLVGAGSDRKVIAEYRFLWILFVTVEKDVEALLNGYCTQI